MVEPTNMELYVGRVDGTEIRQVTHLGGANWAPYFHPSGEKIFILFKPPYWRVSVQHFHDQH